MTKYFISGCPPNLLVESRFPNSFFRPTGKARCGDPPGVGCGAQWPSRFFRPHTSEVGCSVLRSCSCFSASLVLRAPRSRLGAWPHTGHGRPPHLLQCLPSLSWTTGSPPCCPLLLSPHPDHGEPQHQHPETVWSPSPPLHLEHLCPRLAPRLPAAELPATQSSTHSPLSSFLSESFSR